MVHRRAFLGLNAELRGQIGGRPILLLGDLAAVLLYLQGAGAVIVLTIEDGGVVGGLRRLMLMVQDGGFAHRLAQKIIVRGHLVAEWSDSLLGLVFHDAICTRYFPSYSSKCGESVGY